MAWSDILNTESGASARGKINVLGQTAGSLKTFGIYDYDDAATSITPIAVTGGSGFVALTNDAAGPSTNKTYALPNIADVWDTGTNRFNFTGLSLGDTVDIRLDLLVTTSTPNQNINVDLFLAEGGASYSLPWFQQTFRDATAHQLLRFNGIYVGNADTRNNPAYFGLASDSDASVQVNGWYCRVLLREPLQIP